MPAQSQSAAPAASHMTQRIPHKLHTITAQKSSASQMMSSPVEYDSDHWIPFLEGAAGV